jgi:hypothetical protein
MARSRRRLSRPMRTTWIIALILGIAGILAHVGVLPLPELRAYAFWLVAAAFGLLVIGTMADGI